VNCSSGHIQCNYSSAYLGYNIQLNESAMLLEIYRHVEARYTANLMRITAHILQFVLCELWSRPYTKYLQLRIFRLRYSAECSSPAIGGISTIQWALYCKVDANTAHILQFTLCGFWTRSYTMKLELRIFRLQYSTESICAAIGDISTIQCLLYCKIDAK
jgi:hypothetical protein